MPSGARVCDYCTSAIVRDPGDLSLLCPECFARNAMASRFCTACGVAFRPETPGSFAPEIPCPDCGGLMPVRLIGTVPVNECPACNGLWVEEERFDALVTKAIDAQRAAFATGAPPPTPRVQGGNPVTIEVKYRKCPVCDSFMLRRNYRRTSGVVVDSCRDHGTWLDADELEQIAGFILSGGLERSERARESTMRAESGRRGGPGPDRASTDFTRILMERDLHHGQRRLLGNFVEFLNHLLH